MRRSVTLALTAAVALSPAARAEDAKGGAAAVLEKKTYTGSDGKVLRYRLLKPEGYTPDTKTTYPLVVFLHGAGERGDDNTAQLKHVVPEFLTPEHRRDHPCFLIAPQCPEGQKWAEVDWSAATHKQPKEPSGPMKLLIELIPKLEKEYPIDAKRVYLAGLSMGGYGTWDLLARKPKLFAAGVPVCGGGDEGTAEKIANIPIWVFHGDKDNAVPVSRSRTMVEALKKAGAHPKYTEYPGVGHNSWDKAYREPELWKWLFAQKRE
jgi:predicted peptidase